jgi:hypothetical protein|tara:strand:- start:18272 stop:18382 length:111 start_codon:yes stop_codon:yes gene_type:complete
MAILRRNKVVLQFRESEKNNKNERKMKEENKGQFSS